MTKLGNGLPGLAGLIERIAQVEVQCSKGGLGVDVLIGLHGFAIAAFLVETVGGVESGGWIRIRLRRQPYGRRHCC